MATTVAGGCKSSLIAKDVNLKTAPLGRRLCMHHK